MSNLDNLIQKILDDANTESVNIREEADKKRNEIIHEQEEKAKKERDILIEKSKKDALLQDNMILSNAELRVRNDLLKARQDILDKTFQLAKEKLVDLNDKEYTDFVQSKLKGLNLKDNETLVVPKAKVALVKSLDLKLEISDTPSVKSGFILMDNNVNYNFSFDTLIDFQRDDLEAEIAKMLFMAND